MSQLAVLHTVYAHLLQGGEAMHWPWAINTGCALLWPDNYLDSAESVCALVPCTRHAEVLCRHKIQHDGMIPFDFGLVKQQVAIGLSTMHHDCLHGAKPDGAGHVCSKASKSGFGSQNQAAWHGGREQADDRPGQLTSSQLIQQPGCFETCEQINLQRRHVSMGHCVRLAWQLTRGKLCFSLIGCSLLSSAIAEAASERHTPAYA